MAARSAGMRIVLVVAVLAAVAVGTALLLADRPVAAALGEAASTAPVTASPTPTPTPAPSAEPVPEPAPEHVLQAAEVPQDDPATVFVEDDFVELPPVGIDEEADYGNDVTVTLDDVERVDGTGAGPGEVAGPSVLVTLTLHNDSDKAVDLGAVVVDMYTESGALGTPLLGDERTAVFEGRARPGRSVSATYVMRVPDPSNQIKVTVSYEAETPAVSFLGEV